MKQHYFVKFDPRINKFTGCQRATLILNTLEYWFQKKPDGFYKFIEPCPHRLYKIGDSWTEQLDCDRKSFASSFDKIAVRYKSRRAYEEAEDKFQEKMYASIYDRNTNQTYFVRNHELANKVLSELSLPKKNVSKKESSITLKANNPLPSDPLRNGKNSRSYMETKNSTENLSKDKSHAEEIIKKMIEIWTIIVQEGRGQIDLEGKIIPFLKKAFKDKFSSCLQKWKEYCLSIARSKFLMGEKTPWKVDLEWALKFESIRKILSGNYYGIGDRIPKVILPSQTDLQEELLNAEETQEVKDFRALCLQAVGSARYISNFKNLRIEFQEEGDIVLTAPHKFGADFLEQNCYSYLRLILQGLGEHITKISILAPGETRGRFIERKREGGSLSGSSSVSIVEPLDYEDFSPVENNIREDEPLPKISLETRMLREKLKNTIPLHKFPSWLGEIEVEAIGKNGTVVVVLKDSLAVDWCRSRFNDHIFQSVSSIWIGVKRLVIQQKAENDILLCVDTPSNISEDVEEKSRFEQAIQSLRSLCSPNFTETQRMQADCLSFV